MIEAALRMLPVFSPMLAVDWLFGVTSKVDAGLDGVATGAAIVDGCRSVTVVVPVGLISSLNKLIH